MSAAQGNMAATQGVGIKKCDMSDFQKPIFLVGYRGSGKSTVARLLAERLQWNWIDADEMLGQRQGQTIRQIFEKSGEQAFRDTESGIIKELCLLSKHVVATGGGAILRDENRRRIKNAGFVVWLKADSRTLWERLKSDQATREQRPDLTIGGLAEIESLLEQRSPLYAECADYTLNTIDLRPEEIVEAILKKLSESKKLG